MSALMSFARGIDRITTFIGRAVAWLVLVVVLVSAGNAVIRKIFDISSNAWLELQWYLFGAIFMLAAAWTLQRNEHIRVDIVSSLLSKRTRDWIDFLGHLVILLPFVTLMVYLLWPYVLHSYEINEYSPNAGGLIVWPAKALLLAGFALLFLQAISELIKRAAVLFAGYPDETPAGAGHAEAAELATLAPDEQQGGTPTPTGANGAPDSEAPRR
ncbi:TRAP transporter small permease subunit [Jiella sp. MQZ9-1]|uniref:TRAP transporter small permease protein n=1 Tax=Jiella flava TaxID=2816857 RepID=A0A939JV45_9HYPH|nr:TRAP transporter small permease subunit [Jiella flava]MBO0661627.1 TRAP transporter small permease subunit [Jiella flava]MCD2470269.1 TRAP transporter small permease subunit [Jiella flava]